MNVQCFCFCFLFCFCFGFVLVHTSAALLLLLLLRDGDVLKVRQLLGLRVGRPKHTVYVYVCVREREYKKVKELNAASSSNRDYEKRGSEWGRG